MPEWTGSEANQGDDCAGTIESVGENVPGFHKGDRVAGFHQTMAPGGTYAEYALCPAWTTMHIPQSMSFEEAATIPLTAGTAATGLFERVGGLGLPLPFLPATGPMPLVIYGASGSVGTFALQLASKASIHPLVCVAGGGSKSVEPFLDRKKGDTIIDYRKGDDEVISEIKDALDGIPLRYGLDTVAHKSSTNNIAQAMPHGGQIARVLPPEGGLTNPYNDIEQFQLSVGTLHGDQKDFGAAMFKIFERGLQEGWVKPRPYEVVPGGLGGIEQALANLKAGKASAIKYVFRVADTEGVS